MPPFTRVLAMGLLSAWAFGSLGCASRPAPRPREASQRHVPAGPVQATPPGHLARAEVDHVLVTQGPGVIIRRILYEEVVNGGKFIGWRMVGLPEEWRDIDLRPGDIVTRVNGLPIERPEQAWEAWKSLATSPDLRITLTRDGGARTLVLPIDGAPVPDTLTALGREPGPSRPAAEEGRGQPARTVIDSEQEAY